MAEARAAFGLPPVSPSLSLSLGFTESQTHFAHQVLARLAVYMHRSVREQYGVPFWGKSLSPCCKSSAQGTDLHVGS